MNSVSPLVFSEYVFCLFRIARSTEETQESVVNAVA